MNLEYSIKNFKAFDKEGAEFDIRPITILTGCNSSGKSSVVKSILALDKFLSAIKNDNEGKRLELSSLYSYPMQFNVGQLKLGRYDCVLNRKSANDGTITFGYTVESRLAARKFHVNYVFEASKNILNDAHLNNIRICTEEGVKVLDKDGLNLLSLRDAFFKKLIYDQLKIFENKIYQIKDAIELFGNKYGDEDKLISLQDEYDKFNSEFGNNLTDYERYCFSPGHNMTVQHYEESFSTSCTLGILSLNSLFSMPALESLASVSKDNFLSEFEKVTPDELQSNAEWIELKQVIADNFRKSRYDTFGEYFRSKEESELSNCVVDPKKGESLDIAIYGDLMNLIDENKGSLDIKSGDAPFGIIARALYLCSLSDEVFSHSLLSRQDRTGRLMEIFDKKAYLLPSVAAFSKYAEKLIHELLLPHFVSNVNYIGSSRAEIKRLYSVDDCGDAFDNLVVEYENQKQQYASSYVANTEFKPGSFIDKWLKKFKIADSMSFRNTAEGIGIMLYLHQDKGDVKGHLLADEGYGITQLISILLGIEISIMKGKRGKFTESRSRHYDLYNREDFLLLHDYNIQPLEFAWPLEGTLLIEEPETHLHPKYQSMLAEMFLDAYTTYNIQFVVETHSEYLIRKFQTFVAKHNGGRILSEIISEAESSRTKKLVGFNREGFAKAFLTTMSRDEISVYYLYGQDETPSDGSSVKKLELKEDGRLASQFGPGFFDEADNLAMDLLSIKMQRL